MNETSNKNLGFSTIDTSSFAVKPCVDSNSDVNTMVSDNNSNVPSVPLNSCEVFNGNEEHWRPSFIADELFVQMCEKGSRYYIEAAKYAGRISAGNFDGPNTQYKPVFEIHYKDFTAKLQDELQTLLKESPNTLREVVQDAVFQIFKARHRLIFYQYIENEGLNWRFVDN